MAGALRLLRQNIRERVPWLKLAARHMVGQGVVYSTNVILGLIILRLLSVEEFALYTLSMVFLQAATLCSDMGLSQAINSLGARIHQNRELLGSLYSSARFYGYKLYAASGVVVTILFLSTSPDHDLSRANMVASLVLMLLIVAAQIPINFRKSILNIHHDAHGLFQAGMLEAAARLLCLPVCLALPYASAALMMNLIGVWASLAVLLHHSRSRVAERPANPQQKGELKAFITPLVPVVLYHSLQGQLSFLLLGLYGFTSSISQVGALIRLGQVITVPMLLNGFMIQPIFSRIRQKDEYIKKTVHVLAVLLVFSSLVMATAFAIPDWWLLLLGEKYHDLSHVLPLAILTALCTLAGATVYTMVISRNFTRGQSWYILVGLLGQVLFLSIQGVHSTYDALVLNFLPVLSYLVVQLCLLGSLIRHWKSP